jgi:hypothetical protein
MSKKAYDKFHTHEALDRASLARDMVEDFLVDHPFIVEHPAIRDKVDHVVSSLAEIYQDIAAISSKEKKEGCP